MPAHTHAQEPNTAAQYTARWRDRAIGAGAAAGVAALAVIATLAGLQHWPPLVDGVALTLMVVASSIGSAVWVRRSLGAQIERMGKQAYWAGYGNAVSEIVGDGANVRHLPATRRPTGA